MTETSKTTPQASDTGAEHPDAQLVRTVMARECDTVNEYYALAERASSDGIRALLLHLAKEEKEHIAECSLVLARLDADYQRYLEKPLGHISHELEGDDDGAPTPVQHSTSLESGPTLSSQPNHLTVGSLFRSGQ